MIAIDTNILVRMFVDDAENQQQIQWVSDLVRQQEAIYLSQIVQVEAVWIFETVYELTKSEIVTILRVIANHPAIILEKPDQFVQALTLYESNPADFSDYVIFANAESTNCVLWTFDKKLSKTQGVIKLNAESLQQIN